MSTDETLKKFMRTEINLLYNLSKRFVRVETHPEQLILDVVRMLSDIEGIERIAFYVAESDQSKISLVSSVGVEEKSIRLSKREGVVGFIFKQGYPVVIKNLAEEPLFLNKIKRADLSDVNFIGVPIKYEDRAVGVITVDVNKGFVATANLVDLLVMVSNLIGSYIYTYIRLKEREDVFKEEIAALRSELMKKFKLEGFVGVSKAYYSIIKQVLKIAELDVTVMIRGESGTGKTTLAKVIHYLSPRKNKPFIEINCSAIPTELLEAELFGYEKGAFTGAYTTKMGKVEIANGGTLFFDEIGDLNLTLQAKLLRFMQTKEFERLGSNRTIKSDVRIIVATNKNLEDMVTNGEFREDLYYRIAVYPIYIPPLRERKEDIPMLVEYCIKQIGSMMGKKLRINKDALGILTSCDFPGNVRELISCLTRAAISSSTGIIQPDDISCIGSGVCFSHLIKYSYADKDNHVVEEKTKHEEKEIPKDEKTKIIEVLERVGYVQAKAARLLGMTVRQLNYRIKKYGIEIKKI
ncbi:transcriptional regulator, NifA subfamily, Fis Family [Hydrogenobacter thermophilus TK-6]|uniref:Nif-specific regulatory protein n=2 Tax=Hydrogenobacter thermophilus TaxID=940 RepID=D3DIE0_HYDTT|nr:transcriptional regulator, NifA subfamily, Fis Family [Hydrogenobacter thermophilus TK-6]BAI69592.1 Nif-specific regulatory protein [Hydrogenobacter thermophilus TK-6]